MTRDPRNPKRTGWKSGQKGLDGRVVGLQLWRGSSVNHLGYFEDEVKAAMAYDRAALKAKGADASTNFCPSLYGEPVPDPKHSKKKRKTAASAPLPLRTVCVLRMLTWVKNHPLKTFPPPKSFFNP
jgi:hypothetical protein